MVGPAANGSLNGNPISIIPAPLFSNSRMMFAVSLRFGYPAVKYMESNFSLLFSCSFLLILFIENSFYHFREGGNLILLILILLKLLVFITFYFQPANISAKAEISSCYFTNG